MKYMSYHITYIHTLASLSSEKESTMIPNTMFRPIVVTMMKKVMSKKKRSLLSFPSLVPMPYTSKYTLGILKFGITVA